MSTVELTDEAMALARQEASRRGISVDEVVDEAVRRSIAGEDLRHLLDRFSDDDLANPSALSEASAQQLADQELTALRQER